MIDLLLGGSPCFLAGTKVITDSGYKNIEDVEVGDFVLTHKNRYRKVLRTGNSVKNTFILKAQGIVETTTTGNHPYYIRETSNKVFSEPIWKEVKSLKETDCVGLPIIALNKEIKELSHAVVIDDILWLPVKSIKETNKTEVVYNLEVEEDNSYTANNAIVHNCQGFSFAGKQLNFSDPRSKLFFDYVKALETLKPKYFLLENVKMKQEYQDIISKLLGVEPILINSALLSGQNRERLYWTNIPDVKQPADKGILLKDIIESGYTDRNKSYCIDANYYKGSNAKNYLEKSRRQVVLLKSADKVKEQMLAGDWRKLSPLECERLQTLPDGFTGGAGVSDTQRYKALGNGWTRDVIAHILSFIPEEELNVVVSLFDGISCGQAALEKADKKYNQYYASEIDTYAMKITQKNYPHTMQLGDVTKIDWDKFLELIAIINKMY